MIRRRTQARSGARTRRPMPRPSGRVLGWAAAAVTLVGLALVVGRPAADQEVLGGAGGSPSPSGPIPITFGAAVDAETLVVAGETARFGAGDAFAYAVALPGATPTGSLLVEVVRLDGDEPTVVQEPLEEPLPAGGAGLAVSLPAERLLAAWGPGHYEMRIYLPSGGGVVASGRFTLVAAEP